MRRRSYRYRPNKVQSVVGIAAGGLFILLGIFVAIPTFGLFGMIWTLFAVGITASNAQGIIDNLPIAQIVAGVNNLLRQLEKRQVPVYDWDNEGRTLYRLQMRRGKVFYLAEQKNPGQGSPEGK